MDPVPKKETRVFTLGNGRKIGVTPEVCRNAKITMKRFIERQAPEEPFLDPVAIRIFFILARPKSHVRKDGNLRKGAPLYPTGKNCGDWDNFSKLVCDSLNELVIHDDSQVVEAHVYKRYADNCPPRIIISVEPLEDDEITGED